MNAFDRAAENERQVTRQDLLETLYTDVDHARNDPNTIVEPIRLTSSETQALKSSPTSIFWFKDRRLSFASGCLVVHKHRS